MQESPGGFVIEDVTYPFPTLDSLDLDELEMMYLATGWSVEDFIYDPDTPNAEEIVKRIIHPATIKTMARIAYARKHPDLDPATVMRMAGKANAMDALAALLGGGERPPAQESTSTPDGSSRRSSVDSNESSGTDSTASSDAPADLPATTGTGVSGTSSPQPPARMSGRFDRVI